MKIKEGNKTLKQAKDKTENMSTDMSTGRQHIWKVHKINKVSISKGQDSWRGKSLSYNLLYSNLSTTNLFSVTVLF